VRARRRTPARLGGEGGQALVELVACLPAIVLVVLALAQGLLVLSAGGAKERALERARVAAAAGLDPVAAARDGLGKRAQVRLTGQVLTVSLPVPRVLGGFPLPAAAGRAWLVR
jgi:hypothetical protein